MALDFSFFADDMVLEILGHLPALDIVRYRRVCRRIYQASKERSVWMNVLERTQCPLPHIDLKSMPLQELEKLLVQMEIMDAKWLGTRPSAPHEYRNNLTGEQFSLRPFYGFMSNYVILSQQKMNTTTFSWYRRDDFRNPVMEYPVSSSLFQDASCEIEFGVNVLHIADVQPSAEHPDSNAIHGLKIAKFEVSNGNVLARTSERSILLRNPVPEGEDYDLSIQSGYAIIFRYGGSTTNFELVHLDTGRTITCPAITRYMGDGGNTNLFREYVIVTSHMIQLFNGTELALFQLPSAKVLEDPRTPIGVLEKTHSGRLPRHFDTLRFFPRSPTSIVVIGLVSDREESEVDTLHIHFLTLDLEPDSTTCRVRTDSVFDVTGNMHSFHLAPCSPSSRSALGLLTVEVPLPTHTASGRRIARPSRAIQVYQLAVRIDFGLEGRIPPSIIVNEVDLGVDNPGGRANVCAFDPYTGQVLLEDYESLPGHPIHELIVADYVSP